MQLAEERDTEWLGTFLFEEKHKLMDKWLHYFEAYERFFSKYKEKDVTILEIGVFKGGSFRCGNITLRGKIIK